MIFLIEFGFGKIPANAKVKIKPKWQDKPVPNLMPARQLMVLENHASTRVATVNGKA